MSDAASAEAAAKSVTSEFPGFIEHVLQQYGDLVFDLCDSVLWDSSAAQLAFRAILTKVRKQSASAFKEHERAWILQIACGYLMDFARHHGHKTTASEQIEMDASPAIPIRLKQFDHFFHRLPAEDKLILLLRDKYSIPIGEIAAATGTPEGTLKVRRQQALRTLEDWLWGDA